MSEGTEDKDTLLILDENDGSAKVLAAKEGKDGKLNTAKPDSRPEEFMKIEGKDMLDTLVRNFNRQNNNPQGLKYLYLPAGMVVDVVKAFGDFMMDKNENSINSLKEYEVRPTVERRFKEGELNWDQMAELGISKEYAQKQGWDKTLLEGGKTPLVTVNIMAGNTRITAEARLGLTRNPSTGEVKLNLHPYRRMEQVLNSRFNGYSFSEQDKKNLMETGHMGRPAMLTHPFTKEKAEYLIALDPFTNEPVAAKVSALRVPERIKGVELTAENKADLQAGKEIKLEDMEGKNGPFDANLRINAEKRQIEFRFDSWRQSQADDFRYIADKKLTDEQHNSLLVGNRVDMGSLTAKDGRYLPPVIYLNEGKYLHFDKRNEQEKAAYQKANKPEQAPDVKQESVTPAQEQNNESVKSKGIRR